MAKNVKYTIDLNDLMTKKLLAIESVADRLERKLNGLGNAGSGSNFASGMKSSAIAAGVALGEAAYGILRKSMSMIFSEGKDVLESARKYQLDMLRIQNVSKEGFGESNQQYILQMADRFKIPIESAVESYGKFLGMVRNSPYSAEQLNKLNTDIMTLSKVYGLSQEELTAPIRETGKQLGVGVLEGRVMRQLERTMPQVIRFIADELHMSLKNFNKFISEGLTKTGVSSDVLLSAFSKLSASIQDKLPSTLMSLDSAMNEVHNWWFKIKQQIAQTEGFNKFMLSIQNLTKDPELADKFIKFGSQMFDMASRFVDSIKLFLENGGLDKIQFWVSELAHAISLIVENFGSLMTIFVASKAISLGGNLAGSFMGSVAGAASIDAIGAAIAPYAAAAALIVAPAVMYKLGWFSNPNSMADRQKREFEEKAQKQTAEFMADKQAEEIRKFLGTPVPTQVGEIQNLLKQAGVTDIKDETIKQAIGDYEKNKNPEAGINGLLETILGETEKNKEILPGTELRRLISYYMVNQITKNKNQTEGGGGSNLENLESKVTGTRPLNIYINMDSMIKNMPISGLSVLGDNLNQAASKVGEAMIQALNEALVEAEGMAVSRNR